MISRGVAALREPRVAWVVLGPFLRVHVEPFLSHHFNLTVELPLKAVVRGYSYGIVPISWTNRTSGTSKLKLNEMGSRYLFIVLYVFLEHHLSRGDYRARTLSRGSGQASQERADRRLP